MGAKKMISLLTQWGLQLTTVIIYLIVGFFGIEGNDFKTGWFGLAGLVGILVSLGIWV